MDSEKSIFYIEVMRKAESKKEKNLLAFITNTPLQG